MGELRWILFGLGLVALAGIYAYSRFRMRGGDSGDSRARLEPSLDGDAADTPDIEVEPSVEPDVAPPAPPTPEKVVTVRLMSKDRTGFPGDRLVLAMRSAGLRHGQFGIFHAHEADSDQVLFSVANLVEPGSFDLTALTEQRLPGVSLFLLLPCPGDALDAFEQMIMTARRLAGELEGELVDEQGSSLSVQRERYIRDEIQQFVREHLTQSSAAGTPA